MGHTHYFQSVNYKYTNAEVMKMLRKPTEGSKTEEALKQINEQWSSLNGIFYPTKILNWVLSKKKEEKKENTMKTHQKR